MVCTGMMEVMARRVMIQPWATVTCAPAGMWCMVGVRGMRGVVERCLVDGSEAGEGFADIFSSKMGTAEGDTMTAMKTKMIKGMNPRDIHQVYIFDHLDAQAVSHFLPQNRHFLFYNLKPAQTTGILRACSCISIISRGYTADQGP